MFTKYSVDSENTNRVAKDGSNGLIVSNSDYLTSKDSTNRVVKDDSVGLPVPASDFCVSERSKKRNFIPAHEACACGSKKGLVEMTLDQNEKECFE